MLVSRKSAQWICALGLTELFFATALVVCGFIVLGLFNNLSFIGLWFGLPALIPGILSVIVLGTRHTSASVLVFVTNLVIIGIGIWHSIEVYNETDYWDKYRGYAETVSSHSPCYQNGFHCVCHDIADYNKAGYTVQFCDQFRVGEDLFWTMFALTLLTLLFAAMNAFLSAMSIFVGRPENEDDVDGKQPPEYDNRHSYPVSR